MNKKVVLFLTSPNSWMRSDMCLTNFKQLQKLGYDIITLTTSDFLPSYIYENSKVVIHDYTEHVCDSKYYYNYFKESGGYGYFYWFKSDLHLANFFSKTHFPSLLRNTRTLIQFSHAMGYDDYFYCEDDHYFHDDDLNTIHYYFNNLNDHDLIPFIFNMVPNEDNSSVYCSYFHFGKLKKMKDMVKNFAYTSDEFVKGDKNIYMHSYELLFKKLVLQYKPVDFKILEVKTNGLHDVFKNSKINMVFSYANLDDPMRCNFLYDSIRNKKIFYYCSSGCQLPVNVKLIVNNSIYYENTINPGCWLATEVSDEFINDVVLVLNNKITKSFKNLNINDIIYNGQLSA